MSSFEYDVHIVSLTLPPPLDDSSDVTTATDDNNGTSYDFSNYQIKYGALFLLIFPVFTVFGNFLVCLSIFREKNLHTVTNYFIFSLAVADIMVAILVMPLAVYVEVNDSRWKLGNALCDMWVAFDVMGCTSSILNLAAISVDRYIAVTRPIQYAKHRNSKRVYATLALTWVVSIGVSLPIALGMNYTERRHKTPWLCTFYNSDFLIYSSMTSFYVPCLLMILLYWKIFRAIRIRSRRKSKASKSLTGMNVVNTSHETYATEPDNPSATTTAATAAASAATASATAAAAAAAAVRKPDDDRQRFSDSPCQLSQPSEKHFAKKGLVARLSTSTDYRNVLSSVSSADQCRSVPPTTKVFEMKSRRRRILVTKRKIPDDLPAKGFYSEEEELEAASSSENGQLSEGASKLQDETVLETLKQPLASGSSKKPNYHSIAPAKPQFLNIKDPANQQISQLQQQASDSRNKNYDSQDTGLSSEGESKLKHVFISTSLSGAATTFVTTTTSIVASTTAASKTTSTTATAKLLRKQANGRSSQRFSDFGSRRSTMFNFSVRFSKLKHEKSSTKKERKATKTLAIVLAVFLLCWVPFFTINIINAVCIRYDLFSSSSSCDIHPMAFSLFVWLGYINSFLNPLIYTIFNADFRKAFKKILHCST